MSHAFQLNQPASGFVITLFRAYGWQTEWVLSSEGISCICFQWVSPRKWPLNGRRYDAYDRPQRPSDIRQLDPEEASKRARTLYKIAPTQEMLSQRDGSVVMCRYNPTHILDLCNIDAHQLNCKDRRRLETFGCKYGDEPQSNQRR
ncbi:unnamed protein product [Cylicocyclus nassatus]|uniref:Uncharacterized protein n=1 Tax=Cylicocyclus nassatus TaxID=53992 RepID=A0AA36MBW5_CYLNA|nr:unnamed protein product [Cylicocyclus nassatus]